MEPSTPPDLQKSDVKDYQHQLEQGNNTAPTTSSATVKSKPSPLSTLTGNVVTSSNILHTPTTPRIDISRASSSSHHDSRDSSPENVFDQVIVPIHS